MSKFLIIPICSVLTMYLIFLISFYLEHREKKGGDPMVTIRFKTFSIVVPKETEEDFIAELESLCKHYAGQAYHFRFDVEG